MHIPHQLSTRLKWVIVITACAFASITLYLYHLQIIHSQFYLKLSQNNFLRKETIASPRGNITDSSGTLLATNRPLYNLYWRGTGNHSFASSQQQLIEHLSKTIAMTPELLIQIKNADRRSEKIIIARDIPFSIISTIIEQFPQSMILCVEKQYTRHYPYKDLACHIVGYLGLDNDYQGKMGLERVCNSSLQGQTGKLLKVINSVGTHLNHHQVHQALAGKTAETTLKLALQQAAEEAFPKEFNGCCVLMDTSGALEVLLSRPGFDPSIFINTISKSEWANLQIGNAFINRVVSACYPPASLFKLVTLAAALETGIITPAMHWHCIGHTSFKNRLYHCNNLEGHGILSTEQALAHSCNIPFFEIGKRIKIDTLADYANKLGLGIKFKMY